MTIKENMPFKEKNILKDLINKKTHPLSCNCVVCLYVTSKEKPIKGIKKPFGMMSFFLNWLIHAVKINYLKEKGKAEEIIVYGRKAWQYDPGDYEKAPYLKKAHKIIGDLYDDEDLIDFAPDFEKLLNYAYLNVRHWRIERSNFLKILDELAGKRWLDWVKTQPHLQKEWKSNWEDYKFAQNVANYIYSLPEKKIERRILLRKGRFQGKKLKDLVRIHDHLKFNFRIDNKKEGYRDKTTVYYIAKKIRK